MDPQLTRRDVFIGMGLCVGLSALLALVPILEYAFQLLVVLNAHESGHAVAANLGGQFTVPTPLGAAVSFTSSRSFLFAAAEAGALYALLHYARKNSYVFFFWFAAAGLAFIPVIHFLLSDSAFTQLTIWSGLGGEMFWAALLACTFFYRFPPRLEWKKNRFVILPLAMCLLYTGTIRWTASIHDYDKMPWGGLWQGFAIDGDLNRLRDEFGWTPWAILQSYLSTAAICWTIVIGHFGWALVTEQPVEDTPTDCISPAD